MGNKQGFTIAEMIVVIAIIAIISAVVIVSVSKTHSTVKDADIKNDLFQVAKIIEIHKINFKSYKQLGACESSDTALAPCTTDPTKGRLQFTSSCYPTYPYIYTTGASPTTKKFYECGVTGDPDQTKKQIVAISDRIGSSLKAVDPNAGFRLYTRTGDYVIMANLPSEMDNSSVANFNNNSDIFCLDSKGGQKNYTGFFPPSGTYGGKIFNGSDCGADEFFYTAAADAGYACGAWWGRNNGKYCR